jgi:D-alanyl-D-alanine carboxypeptidase (penicillin-binding protein 5/6)
MSMDLQFSRRDVLRWCGLSLAGLAIPALDVLAQDKSTTKKSRDRLSGPPFVSAKGWAILDGSTGKFLWGENENDYLVMASTTKIMTAWLVLDLERKRPDILKETLTVSAAAAKTTGSSAKIEEGDRYKISDLLHGLLLPSGNDAAAAFAEHCGPYYRQEGDPDDPVEAFVAQMNRQAREWKLAQTEYFDPHGLGKNHTSPKDLGVIAWKAMQNETFRRIVQRRTYECEVLGAKDEKRTATWTTTNKLLDIEGYEGIKTGTTNAAGSCLVSFGRRGEDALLMVVLGSTTSDNRYIDSRNLYRWAWRERGHKDD